MAADAIVTIIPILDRQQPPFLKINLVFLAVLLQ
jgi:hypothetical protein